MFINNLKNKNNDLFNNLKNSNGDTFKIHCNILLNFFNEEFIINSIVSELKENELYAEGWKDIKEDILNSTPNFPKNEHDLAALSLKFLEEYSNNYNYLRFLSEKISGNGLNSFHEIFTNYLQLYINHHLEKSDLILYLVNKYKYQCEWFSNEKLLSIYSQNTSHGEELLTKDLREFLFNNGIDYPFSEPKTPSGKPDIVFGINTNKPLALEVKLYGGKNNYGKSYIKKGFHQAISYANDYNTPYAYLFIFNLSEKLLEFNLTKNEEPLHININNKNIFIIVVNLNKNNKSASQTLNEIDLIDEEYLISE